MAYSSESRPYPRSDQLLAVTDRMTETITVRANGMETNALTDTLNDSPIPNMVPGKNLRFPQT